jgi:hypothetical protein
MGSIVEQIRAYEQFLQGNAKHKKISATLTRTARPKVWVGFGQALGQRY